jgi:hypothetical protein
MRPQPRKRLIVPNLNDAAEERFAVAVADSFSG